MDTSESGLTSKLSAVQKKSYFDRQKAEAEAKRARDAVETAAIYDDFVKSFADGDSAEVTQAAPTIGKRHFTSGRGERHTRGSLRSGPGSLGPPKSGPGSLGTQFRKRHADGSEVRGAEGNHPLFAYEDTGSVSLAGRTAVPGIENEENRSSRQVERPISKPTIHVANLPPGLSISAIKALLPTSLRVDNVRLLPPSIGTERKCQGAIMTLAVDTPVTEIENAISKGQNMYLGRGHYLSLSRHLSSVSAGMGINLATSGSQEPFGAQLAPSGPVSLGRAPPPRAFAPPSSYHVASNLPPPQLMQVTIKPPEDLRQLKTIHKTVEAVLEHGIEFESLLMTRPEVQNEEGWAWLWDARSKGGIWYRWRLWEMLTRSSSSGRQKGMPAFVFENGAAWVPPKDALPMEFITDLTKVVEDEEYESEDTDDSEDEARRRQVASGSDATKPMVEAREYLTPMERARLVHMLASLPTSTARLRRGDIANLMSFAINHAGQGGEEIVDFMVHNVEHPFAYTSANQDYVEPSDSAPLTFGKESTRIASGNSVQPDEREDQSPSALIGLFVISDILSSSSTCGVRHAWRYRSLFESALLKSRTFYHLGTVEKIMKWGRLRAEKWRRSILNLLSLWEGWCVFPGETMETFQAQFAESQKLSEEDERSRNAAQPRPILHLPITQRLEHDSQYIVAEADKGEGDIDGEPMDDDLDGVPMEDEDLDGEAMENSHEDGVSIEEGTRSIVHPRTNLDSLRSGGPVAPPPDPSGSPAADIEDMFGNTQANTTPIVADTVDTESHSKDGKSGETSPVPASSASSANDILNNTASKRRRARASDLF